MHEHILDRAFEFGLDGGARLGAREWREPVLQARQVVRDAFAHQVGAGAQHLAELDETGPEILERAGEALTGAQIAGPGGGAEPGQDACGEDQAAGGR